MTSRNQRLEELAALCGELGPGDCIDPRDERTPSDRHKRQRKAWQLCKQVSITLQLALEASNDARLRSIQIISVEPAPDASQLRVLVAPRPDATAPPEELIEQLEMAHGHLREEIGQAISRRRTPDFTVAWVPLKS